MSIDLARRIGRALDVRNETAIRTINQALQAYVRLTPQSATTPMTGSIDASQVVSGEFADARIAETNVTQHEAALEITELQIADLGNYPELDQPEAISGAWTFGSTVGLTGIVEDTLAAQADDYSPTGIGTASVLRISLTGSQSITGIAGGFEGRLLAIYNQDTVDSLTLENEHASSTAENRIVGPNSLDVVIPPRGGALLMYLPLRWRCIATAL